MVAEQEARAVRRDVAEGGSGELVGERQGAGFAVGDEGLGEDAAAILNLGEVDSRAVSGGTGEALEEGISGRDASGEGELANQRRSDGGGADAGAEEEPCDEEEDG